MQSGETGHVSAVEWRWVIMVSVFLVLLAFLPFIWVLVTGLRDSEWQFMGALHDHVSTAAQLARVVQGASDQWLLRYLHTPESQNGTFINVLYALIGQLSRFVALPPVALFHVARVCASLFMYMALYQLAANIWMRIRTRRIFFLVAALGSGLGWLLVPLFGTFDSPDISVPQAFPFYSTLANVHYPLTIAFLALLASIAIPLFRPGSSDAPSVDNGGALVFLSSFMLAIVYPLALIPVILTIIVILVGIRRNYRNDFSEKMRWLLWFIVPALPMLAYYVALGSYNDIVAKIWDQATDQQTPSFLVFLLTFSPLLIVAFPGLWRAARRFEPDGDQFMFVWLVLIVLLIFLPVGTGTEFAAGILIPIVYFCTRSLEDFWFDFVPRRWRLRLGVAALPLLAMTNVLVLTLPIRPMTTGNFASLGGLLLQRDYFDAFDWLESRTLPTDVVLAAPRVGLWVPAWTGARVVYGHPVETADSDAKLKAVIDWYREDDRSNCRSLLQGDNNYGGHYQVRYVLIGPFERNLGDTICQEFLTPLQQAGSVQIYRYDPPDTRD